MTEKRKGIRGGITVALAVLRVWFLALYRGGIYPFGDKSILCIDLYGQYTHFLGFLKNSSPSEFLYSFTKGFGGNTLGLFAYYCISVFNLFVFFFDSMEATAFAHYHGKTCFSGAVHVCLYAQNFKEHGCKRRCGGCIRCISVLYILLLQYYLV